MFRVPFLRWHSIVSDEGFSVTFVSRNILKYDEGGISVLIDIDGDGKQMDVIANSMRASDPKGRLPEETTARKIEHNVARALEWKGWSVRVVG
jgi:hypothetical protein